jgi:hypothetical protein
MKGHGWASSLIKEAAVDSISQSLRLLRKLDSSRRLNNDTLLSGKLEGENHVVGDMGEVVVIDSQEAADNFFKTGEIVSKAYARQGMNESTKLLSSRASRKLKPTMEILGI